MGTALLMLAVSIGWTAAFGPSEAEIGEGQHIQGMKTVRFSAEDAVIIEAYGRDAVEVVTALPLSQVTAARAKQHDEILPAGPPRRVEKKDAAARAVNWWTALAGPTD